MGKWWNKTVYLVDAVKLFRPTVSESQIGMRKLQKEKLEPTEHGSGNGTNSWEESSRTMAGTIQTVIE